MQTVEVTCKKREGKGKSFAKKCRQEGYLPSVVYGEKKDSVAVMIPRADIMAVYRNSDYKQNVLLNLNIEGQEEVVMTKELQQDPVTSRITHIDFLRITDKKAIEVLVPIVISGVAKGQKLGGIVIQSLEKITLLCLPQDVPKDYVVDITSLGLGETISVKDLEKQDSFEILTNAYTAIVGVEVPRAERSKASSEEAEATEESQESESEEPGSSQESA